MAKRPKKAVTVSIGPKRSTTFHVVRNKTTGRIRQSNFSKGFNSNTEQPLVIEAFNWPSIVRYSKDSKQGTKALETILQKLVNHLGNQAPVIAERALRPTFIKSQRYVPVNTGDLKKSGRLEIHTTAGGKKLAEITYGKNGNPFYAVFVHEITSYSHLAPTRAKFLESAIREDESAIERRIARFTKKVINK